MQESGLSNDEVRIRPRASVLQTHFLFVETVAAFHFVEGIGAAGCLG